MSTGTADGGQTLKLEVLLAAATLIVLAMLSFFTRKPTPIDLVVSTSSISLRTADEPTRLPPMIAAAVTIVGDGTISGAPGATAFQGSLTLEQAGSAGPLNVQGITLPPGATLSLKRVASETRTIEVAIRSEGTSQSVLTLFTREAFTITSDTTTQAISDKTPRSIKVTSTGDTLVFRARLAEKAWTTQRPFELTALSFLDADPTNPLPELFSAIDSGVVTFVDIGSILGSNREMRLRPGQFLHIGDISQGFVRSLAFEDDRLTIGIAAEVGVMETRWRGFRQDHMPSWLAYLSSLDGVKEITTTLIGMMLIAFKLIASRRSAG
jgi:hypothetical protein